MEGIEHTPTYSLIALCGHMRSGKDTAADYLCAEYGYRRIAFGDALRGVVYELYPAARQNRNAYREKMQDVGQHMRGYDPDVWVNPALRRIDDAMRKGIPVVVTDMRQPNEYAAMRERGALVVRLDCPAEICAARAGAEAARMGHETERHIDSFNVDDSLANDADYSKLWAQIDALMRRGQMQ